MQIQAHSDLGAAQHYLAALTAKLGTSGMTPVMRDIAVILENSTRKRFESKTAPDGSRWAAWQPETRRRYAQTQWGTKKGKRYVRSVKLRDEARLLRDTSRLLRSITRHAAASMAQVGTNVAYAPFHQSGTRNMVARPMFGISHADRADIYDSLNDWLKA